jgi:hypothetical protein
MSTKPRDYAAEGWLLLPGAHLHIEKTWGLMMDRYRYHLSIHHGHVPLDQAEEGQFSASVSVLLTPEQLTALITLLMAALAKAKEPA